MRRSTSSVWGPSNALPSWFHIFTPLYSGGLCEAVTMSPQSKWEAA
ncbi:MAG: hypothetical protein A4E29_00532 [Methanomassiliicoccales archaeon PtaB.Bin134]|nr:MAG: hypothetical protein A4E29_00532 [Methanomassiliicoccales archaeon PtaB.Bin134]